MDGTLYLQNKAFEEGQLRGCRVISPLGKREQCCCEHAGCCD